MRTPSFRLRIALLSTAISGAVLAVFGTVAWLWMAHERLETLDREIRALAYRHPGWMNSRANYVRLASAIEFIFGEERREELILLVRNTTGGTLFRSHHWPADLDADALDLTLDDAPGTGITPPGATSAPVADEAMAGDGAGPDWGGPGAGRGPGWGRGRGRTEAGTVLFSKVPRFRTVRTVSTSWRIGVLGDGDQRLVLGLDLAGVQGELARMRNGFLVALPPALGLIGLGGWWVAGRAVRPLRSITRMAQQVTARGLDQRIPASREDPEIARLIEVLNGMMERLDRSFRQAIRFSADASHELKTPLAIMQGELENALQAAEAGSREQQVYAHLLEETDRLKAITRGLLLLARADAGQLPLSPEPVPWSDDLRDLVEDARVLAEARGLRVEAAIEPGVRIEADRALLRQAVSNLVDNAIKYNETGGLVRLALAASAGEIRLEVSNTGPGIAETDRARVFDRFYRGAAAGAGGSVEGAGLGLSLAWEIVRAHGGRLELERGGSGETTFLLALPVRSDTRVGGRVAAG